MSIPFTRGACAALVSWASLASCWAQGAPALQEVTVTGNPLGAADAVAPTTRLEGEALVQRRQGTLGQTLDGLPGVSSSYFGPNASRPVVRGLDGDRIRVLQNSGAMLDASALSFDHAVPSDPLTIERIEVLRGPGALLYGGSAVGGVVNLIDNRIPRSALFGAEGGVTGATELGLSSGNHGRDGAVLLEGGNDRYALHADASSRRTRDVAVPVALACSQPGHEGIARRICNSASDTQSGAVGGSLLWDHGYLGASVTEYRSDYGTVAEDEVSIGMRSRRYALQGEWRRLPGWITSVKLQAAHTRYRHTEFEGAEAGTRFRNQGNDLRLEARHAPVGAIEGVIGLQLEGNRFAAEGEEAFAPASRTRQAALFVYEELPTGWGKWTVGARAEQVRVRSDGSSDPDVTRFAEGERRFAPRSLAGGALVRLAPGWQFTANLAHTERAPRDYELFANGPHLATAAWETGNPTLGLEKSNSADLGLAWAGGPHEARLNVYASRFANYIGLADTGNTRAADGTLNPDPSSGEEALADLRYAGQRARFVGAEASGTVRLLGQDGLATVAGAHRLDLRWRADLVRATNRDTGESLPRIAPARLGATLAWAQGPWGAELGADHVRAQHRVPTVGQRATDGYTLWNAGASYRMPLGGAELLWFVRVDNLSDVLAYSAVSVLTTTAFPKAPLPGRSARLGVRMTF